jgi:phosphate uptake regulator
VCDARIEELEKKREKSLSPQVSQETTRQVEKLNKEGKEIDRQIDRLEEGGDEEYRAWRDRLLARRFKKPKIMRVLDVQFEIANSVPQC